jgi:hypothetical protein
MAAILRLNRPDDRRFDAVVAGVMWDRLGRSGMKLTAKYDVEAGSAFVFGHLADFDGWERAAMRRGAEVERVCALSDGVPNGGSHIGPGVTWETRFRFDGKARAVTVRLERIAPDTALALTGTSRLADARLEIDVIELSALRTRLLVRLDIKPKTVAARIYVQSLRLVRSRVERSFAQRIAQLGVEIENRQRAARAAGL